MTVPEAFIASCLSAARTVKVYYGVPVSVCIAQAALESGWGQHVVDNAYFGIKGHGTAFQTTEIIDGKPVHEVLGFRAYTSFFDAAMGYGEFLKTNPRYKACFDHTDDPIAFVEALAAAGYSTSPNYATEVIAIIQGHNLTQYDTE